MAYCPKCGNFVPDDVKVCGFCGTPMTEEAAEAAAAAEGFAQGVEESVQEGVEAAVDAVAEGAEAAADTAENAWDTATDAATDVANDAATDVANDAVAEGAEAVEGAAEEAADAWSDPSKLAESMAAATAAAEATAEENVKAAADPWSTEGGPIPMEGAGLTGAEAATDGAAGEAATDGAAGAATDGAAGAEDGKKKEEKKKGDGKKKGGLVGIIIAIVAVILVCCCGGGALGGYFAFFKKTNVKLNKNTVKVDCGDYNGYGEFEADLSEIRKEYKGKIKYVKGKEYPGYPEPVDALIAKCITVKADPATGIKNGDKVKVTFEVDQKAVQEHFKKVKVSSKDFEIKVKGLTDVDSFDAFEGVSVEANGINGYGRIALVKHFAADSPANDFSYAYTYSPIKDAYSNGDEITVTIDYYGIYDMCARNYSKVPESIEKTFTVSGLKEIQDVNPFDYANIEFEGTDPYGRVKITNTSNDEFVSRIDFEIEGGENGQLKNGDTIRLIAEYAGRTDADLVEVGKKNFAVNLTQTVKEVTISGMPTAEELDAFADLTLTFKGHEPYGTLTLSVGGDNKVVSGLTFKADKKDNLSNGDEVTVTITRETWGGKEDPEEYALKNGYALKSLTKTYTVEGLSKYYTDMSEIPEDTLEDMKKEAVDAWTDLGAKIGNYKMSSLDYMGGVILARKGGWSNYGDNTYIFLVYKMNGNIDYEGYDGSCTDPVSSYVYVRFRNIEEVDGEVVVNVNDHEESDGYYQNFEFDTGVHANRYSSDTYKIKVKSYKDLDTLGEEVITKNRNNYNYTTDITGLSETPERETESETETEDQTEAESELESESETEEE